MNRETSLRDEDALELGEMLEFLHDWIDFHCRQGGESLDVFTGGGYTVDELRADLARFVFLLGGDSRCVMHGADQ